MDVSQDELRANKLLIPVNFNLIDKEAPNQ